MSVAHLLPDFGASRSVVEAETQAAADIEGLKLEAFESGYKAGWDDSVSAQNDESARVSAELARNLHDLSFTYHEARSQLLTSLRPLLTQMVEMVLPELGHRTLAARVAAELEAAADRATGVRVRLLAAEETLPALERLADQDFGFPLAIVADPGLGPGQVMLRFADEERQIDMDALLSGIRAALDDHFDDHLQESAHG